MMLFWTVIFTAVPLIENVSSRPQATETWSKIMFLPSAIVMPSFPESPLLPIRIRMYLTIELWALENEKPFPYTVIPPPGAVWPAI